MPRITHSGIFLKAPCNHCGERILSAGDWGMWHDRRGESRIEVYCGACFMEMLSQWARLPLKKRSSTSAPSDG